MIRAVSANDTVTAAEDGGSVQPTITASRRRSTDHASHGADSNRELATNIIFGSGDLRPEFRGLRFPSVLDRLGLDDQPAINSLSGAVTTSIVGTRWIAALSEFEIKQFCSAFSSARFARSGSTPLGTRNETRISKSTKRVM